MHTLLLFYNILFSFNVKNKLIDLQSVMDDKKTRVVEALGESIENYDPRVRDWYTSSTIVPRWSPMYRGASTGNWM